MTPGQKLLLAGFLIGAAWFFRGFFERDPVAHILVQLPILALAGALIAMALVDHMDLQRSRWNAGGVPAILIAILAILFWMLPRSIDSALIDGRVELLKFITIPSLIGAPLALSLRRAHPLLRGFLKAQTVSMLGVMAFLYTHAPVRICNSYLVVDQERLGLGFLVVAFAFAILWTLPLFFTPATSSKVSASAAQVACS